ncbi:MAG: hypothetical protein ACM4AI_02040 [Acidobacteriota bacterium]
MSKGLTNFLFRLPFSLRQRHLARDRKALTETEFVRRIMDQGGDPDAAISAWGRLRDWGYEEGFTPYPEDSLGSVFGITEEEKDEDLVLSILKELDVPVPSQETINGFGKVETLLQIAKFVAFCRKQEPR